MNLGLVTASSVLVPILLEFQGRFGSVLSVAYLELTLVWL